MNIILNFVTIWVLTFNGSDTVNSKEFETKESCRQYAIVKLEKMKPLADSFQWSCQARTKVSYPKLDPNDIEIHEYKEIK